MQNSIIRWLLSLLKLDMALIILLGFLILIGMVILYSAADQSQAMMNKQLVRFGIGFLLLLIVAQIQPITLRFWTPWIYGIGVVALLAVLQFGVEGKGAQRWLNLGFVRVQPSEFMKLAVPMMLAWFFSRKQLPPRFWDVVVGLALAMVPMLLIIKQPDLGTALLVGFSGFFVIFMAGIRWRYLLGALLVCIAAAPLLWRNLHAYQQKRILTLFNPESDPLGSGYHIIQSKIAVGSGGLYGKGWLNGTQSQLDFLPERHTDFIFSVFGEEFGWFGAVLLLVLYLLIVFRSLAIAVSARDDYSRLFAGSISLTFFLYLLVNVGMVTGLLPVVGVPLPLISYGGTSIVTLMLGFGMLMGIRADRRMMMR